MNPAAAWEAFKAGRKLLTLVAVLVAAATVYVWWQTAEKNRTSLIAAADGICEAAGQPFRPQGVENRDWGLTCLERVRWLRRVETDLANESLNTAIDAMNDQAAKVNADASRAASMARRTDQRLQRMEQADAAVQDDIVGPSWAGSVNDLGGLRPAIPSR